MINVTGSLSGRAIAGSATPLPVNAPKTGGAAAPAGGRELAAVVRLSAQAMTIVANQGQAPDPGQAAGKKDFTTVVQDARRALDSRYAEREAAGKPMDYQHATQESWDSVYGGLDRRALYAIASNSGGAFSKDEQDTAQSIMSRQQGQAMMAADPGGNDVAARYKAGITFLEGASDEEKSSANWAMQRAATQFGYENASRQQGHEPETLDSDSPVVRMIKGALDGLKDKAPGAVAAGGYVHDLSEVPLLRGGGPDAAAGTAEPVNITA